MHTGKMDSKDMVSCIVTCYLLPLPLGYTDTVLQHLFNFGPCNLPVRYQCGPEEAGLSPEARQGDHPHWWPYDYSHLNFSAKLCHGLWSWGWVWRGPGASRWTQVPGKRDKAFGEMQGEIGSVPFHKKELLGRRNSLFTFRFLIQSWTGSTKFFRGWFSANFQASNREWIHTLIQSHLYN